jgi:uncharacterized integral membrane protein
MRTSLIAAAACLIVVMIFIIQNTYAVNISFLGAHLRLRDTRTFVQTRTAVPDRR